MAAFARVYAFHSLVDSVLKCLQLCMVEEHFLSVFPPLFSKLRDHDSQ